MASINLSTRSLTVIAGGLSPIVVNCVTGAATVFAGAVVAENIAVSGVQEVILPTVNYTDFDVDDQVNKALGVVLENADTDIDTDFADVISVRVIPLGAGTIVYCEVVTSLNADIQLGEDLYLAAGGQVTKKSSVFAAPATPVVNELAAALKIGKAMEYSAADANNTRWIKVLI